MWKKPSIVKRHVDMRVSPQSTMTLLQILTDAGIPYHIITDDLHRLLSSSTFITSWSLYKT